MTFSSLHQVVGITTLYGKPYVMSFVLTWCRQCGIVSAAMSASSFALYTFSMAQVLILLSN